MRTSTGQVSNRGVGGEVGGRTPTYETSLPGSPVDGQEIYYAADATNSIIWHLRYRSAARSGSGAWEFVGGSALSSAVATQQSRTVDSYAALATAGPSITLPLNGDYEIGMGARIQAAPTSAASSAVMSFDIGATGAVDANAVTVYGLNPTEAQASRVQVQTGLSAVTLTAKYKRAQAAGTAYFAERWMTVIPIRVW